MRFLGVDPGASGAACVYCPDASVASGMRWHLLDMPIRGEGAGKRLDARAFRDWVMKLSPDLAVIENVNPMPGQGSMTTATFIGIARAIEAVVDACDIPVTLVTPQVWKSGLVVPRVEKTPMQTRSKRSALLKQASRNYAMRRFPELVPWLMRVMDADRAEAALMAYYAYSSQPPLFTDAELDRVDRRAARA